MNRFIQLLVIVTPALFSCHAYAYNGSSDTPHWYGSISGSVVFLNGSDIDYKGEGNASEAFDPGFGFSGAIGYRLYPNVRSELEIAYRSNTLDTAGGVAAPPGYTYKDQRSLAFMWNGYYDFHNNSSLTPYLGAGVGIADVTTPASYDSNINTGATSAIQAWTPAYQLMTGVSYAIPGSSMEAILGYRYFSGSDGHVSDKASGTKIVFSDGSNNLEMGLQFFFK